MTRNRALVEELIRLMNQREQRPTHLCHPDIEWHWAEPRPGPPVYRGHDGLHKGLDTWVESWDELVIEPTEILEEGDYVLAMTQYRMRGAGSGVYLEAPVAHLHQISRTACSGAGGCSATPTRRSAASWRGAASRRRG